MALTGYSFSREVPIIHATQAEAGWQINLEVHKGAGVNSDGVVYLNNHCSQFPYDVRFTDEDGETLIPASLDQSETSKTVRHFTVLSPQNCSEADHFFNIHYGGGNVSKTDLAALLKSENKFKKAAIDAVVPLGTASAWDKIWFVYGATPTYVDKTADMNDAGANDVWCTMSPATTNDKIYWGMTAARFFSIVATIGTLANAVYTITWEYWNGSTWTALDVSDDSNGWRWSGASGANPKNATISWIMPSDWATTAVNGTTAYWVRCCVSSYTSMATRGILTQAWAITADSFHTCTQPWDVKRSGVVYRFYESLETHWSYGGYYRVGVASCPEADYPWGPWTKLGYCMQPSNISGRADCHGTQGPAVAWDGTQWVMAFAGYAETDYWAGILYATISDADFPGVVAGATWTRGDSGNVQIGAVAETWEERVACPAIFFDTTLQKWGCLYNGWESDIASAAMWEVGIALSVSSTFPTSASGWVKSANNPILPFGGVGAKDRYGLVGSGQPAKLGTRWHWLYNGADEPGQDGFGKGMVFCASAEYDALDSLWLKENSGEPIASFPMYGAYIFSTPGIVDFNDGALYIPFGRCPRGATADWNNDIGTARLEYYPYSGADVFEAYYQFNNNDSELSSDWTKTGEWIEEGQTGSHLTDAFGYAGWNPETFLNGKIETKLKLVAGSNPAYYSGVGVRKATANAALAANGYTAYVKYGNKPTSINLQLYCADSDTVIGESDIDNPDWSVFHTLALAFHYDDPTNTLVVSFDGVDLITVDTDAHYVAAGYVQLMDCMADVAGIANFEFMRVSKWCPTPPYAGTAGAEQGSGMLLPVGDF